MTPRGTDTIILQQVPHLHSLTGYTLLPLGSPAVGSQVSTKTVPKEEHLGLGQVQARQLWFLCCSSRPPQSQSANRSLGEASLPRPTMPSRRCHALSASLALLCRRLRCVDQLHPVSLVTNAHDAVVKYQQSPDIYPTHRDRAQRNALDGF